MADKRLITRRAALVGVATSAAAIAAPKVEAAETRFDLQEWLDTAEPTTVINYHLMRLTEAMQEVMPGYWTGKIGEGRDFILISRDPESTARANYVQFFS